MRPFSFGPDTSIVKKCPHCDTALEFESAGQRVVFTAHDEKFCHLATRERVHMLERALLGQREAYERRIKDYERRVDEMLSQHGLPTLAERAEQHKARAQMMAQLCDPNVLKLPT